jgi:hypothetical protein
MTRPAGNPRHVPVPGSPRPSARPARQPLDVLEIVGIVVCCATAVLAGVISVLLTPLYWGSVLVPVSVVLAAASNVCLPVLARRFGRSGFAAALPFVVWLITVIALSITRPEGDVLLPGGKAGQLWVTYGMVLAGGVAGSLTLMIHGMAASRSVPSDPPEAPVGRAGSPRERR